MQSKCHWRNNIQHWTETLRHLQSSRGNGNVDFGLNLLLCKIRKQNSQKFWNLRNGQMSTTHNMYLIIDYLRNCYKRVNFSNILNKYNYVLAVGKLKIVKASNMISFWGKLFLITTISVNT